MSHDNEPAAGGDQPDNEELDALQRRLWMYARRVTQTQLKVLRDKEHEVYRQLQRSFERLHDTCTLADEKAVKALTEKMREARLDAIGTVVAYHWDKFIPRHVDQIKDGFAAQIANEHAECGDTCVHDTQSCRCAICFKKVRTTYVMLPCGHAFHYTCTLRWFASKFSCPTCRDEFRHGRNADVARQSVEAGHGIHGHGVWEQPTYATVYELLNDFDFDDQHARRGDGVMCRREQIQHYEARLRFLRGQEEEERAREADRRGSVHDRRRFHAELLARVGQDGVRRGGDMFTRDRVDSVLDDPFLGQRPALNVPLPREKPALDEPFPGESPADHAARVGAFMRNQDNIRRNEPLRQRGDLQPFHDNRFRGHDHGDHHHSFRGNSAYMPGQALPRRASPARGNRPGRLISYDHLARANTQGARGFYGDRERLRHVTPGVDHHSGLSQDRTLGVDHHRGLSQDHPLSGHSRGPPGGQIGFGGVPPELRTDRRRHDVIRGVGAAAARRRDDGNEAPVSRNDRRDTIESRTGTLQEEGATRKLVGNPPVEQKYTDDHARAREPQTSVQRVRNNTKGDSDHAAAEGGDRSTTASSAIQHVQEREALHAENQRERASASAGRLAPDSSTAGLLDAQGSQ